MAPEPTGFRPRAGQEQDRLRSNWAAKDVTATSDASDFPDLRDNRSNSPYWNGSGYHDLAAHLSVLIQEQLLTWDPADFSADEVPIRRPADRTRP